MERGFRFFRRKPDIPRTGEAGGRNGLDAEIKGLISQIFNNETDRSFSRSTFRCNWQEEMRGIADFLTDAGKLSLYQIQIFGLPKSKGCGISLSFERDDSEEEEPDAVLCLYFRPRRRVNSRVDLEYVNNLDERISRAYDKKDSLSEILRLRLIEEALAYFLKERWTAQNVPSSH